METRFLPHECLLAIDKYRLPFYFALPCRLTEHSGMLKSAKSSFLLDCQFWAQPKAP
jgi:hypothetical protein